MRGSGGGGARPYRRGREEAAAELQPTRDLHALEAMAGGGGLALQWIRAQQRCKASGSTRGGAAIPLAMSEIRVLIPIGVGGSGARRRRWGQQHSQLKRAAWLDPGSGRPRHTELRPRRVAVA